MPTKTHTGNIAKTHNGKGLIHDDTQHGANETGTGDNEDIQARDYASSHGAPIEGRDEEEQERQKVDNGKDTQVMRVFIGDRPSARAMEVRRVDNGEDTQEMQVFIGDIIGHIRNRPAKDGVLRWEEERDASFLGAKMQTKTHTGNIAKTHNGKGLIHDDSQHGANKTGTGDNEDIQARDCASSHGAPIEGRDEEEQERQKVTTARTPR